MKRRRPWLCALSRVFHPILVVPRVKSIWRSPESGRTLFAVWCFLKGCWSVNGAECFFHCLFVFATKYARTELDCITVCMLVQKLPPQDHIIPQSFDFFLSYLGIIPQTLMSGSWSLFLCPDALQEVVRLWVSWWWRWMMFIGANLWVRYRQWCKI